MSGPAENPDRVRKLIVDLEANRNILELALVLLSLFQKDQKLAL